MTPTDPKDSSSVFKNAFETGREQDSEPARQALGRDLVNRIFMLYRTARLHAPENEAVGTAIDALLKVLADLEKQSPGPTLTAFEDSFYLDNVFLKVDFSSFENFRFLSRLFAKHRIGSLQFVGLPEPEELRSFLRILLKDAGENEPEEWIGDLPFSCLKISLPGEMQETSESLSQTQKFSDPLYLLKLHLKAAFFMNDFLSQLQKGSFPSMNRLQRIVHEFIDALESNADTLMVLAAIRSCGISPADRSIPVLILSLLLGREIGLNKKRLSDLGSAVLLNDIGRTEIPAELLTKTAELTEEEWKKIRSAPMSSLLHLIRLKGFNEAALKRMLVAYEQVTGVQESPGRTSLLARLVAVVHDYVAMTGPQAYRDAMFPREAFKLMKKEAGKKFDPLFLDVLMRLLTLYPPATLLLLETGEVAIVVKRGPVLKILYDAAGLRVDRPEKPWDEVHPKAVRVLDPERLGINPIAVLLPKPTEPPIPSEVS